jgi:hypothetical protein
MSYMKDFVEEVRAMVLHGASVERIAAHMDTAEAQVEAAIDLLMEDDDFRATVGDDVDEEWDFSDEPLSADDDGYAYASAGYGTDEDYGADFTDGEFV